MNRATPVMLVIPLLAGCTADKPVIPAENYQRIATMEVTINECVKRGNMDYLVAATGKNQLSNALNSWRYDPVIYQSIFTDFSAQAQQRPPEKSNCDMTAVSIALQQQQQQQLIQQQQEARAQQQQFNQSMQDLRNAQPQTVRCNNIGAQTVCSKY